MGITVSLVANLKGQTTGTGTAGTGNASLFGDPASGSDFAGLLNGHLTTTRPGGSNTSGAVIQAEGDPLSQANNPDLIFVRSKTADPTPPMLFPGKSGTVSDTTADTSSGALPDGTPTASLTPATAAADNAETPLKLPPQFPERPISGLAQSGASDVEYTSDNGTPADPTALPATAVQPPASAPVQAQQAQRGSAEHEIFDARAARGVRPTRPATAAAESIKETSQPRKTLTDSGEAAQTIDPISAEIAALSATAATQPNAPAAPPRRPGRPDEALQTDDAAQAIELAPVAGREASNVLSAAASALSLIAPEAGKPATNTDDHGASVSTLQTAGGYRTAAAPMAKEQRDSALALDSKKLTNTDKRSASTDPAQAVGAGRSAAAQTKPENSSTRSSPSIATSVGATASAATPAPFPAQPATAAALAQSIPFAADTGRLGQSRQNAASNAISSAGLVTAEGKAPSQSSDVAQLATPGKAASATQALATPAGPGASVPPRSNDIALPNKGNASSFATTLATVGGEGTTVQPAEPPAANTASEAAKLAATPAVPATPGTTGSAPTTGHEHVHLATPLSDPRWEQHFGERVVMLAQGDKGTAQININPANLGPIQVSIDMQGDQMAVQFSSASPEVRQTLEDALPRLREMLSNAGISLGQANVGAQSQQSQREAFAQSTAPTRFTGEGAILAGESQPEGLPSGRLIHSGRGLVDLFA